MTNNITIQNIDEQDIKNFATLVKFEWGDDFSEVAYYAAWTDDIVIGAITYSSLPELEVKIDRQHGGAKDSPAKISIPNTYSPIDKLARPFPHSDCRVLISECDPEDISNTIYSLYFGYVSRILLGKFGSNSMTEISIIGLKSQSEFATGIPANSDCVWALFDKHCKAPYEEYLGIIQTISDNGLTVTVSSPTLVTTTTGI